MSFFCRLFFILLFTPIAFAQTIGHTFTIEESTIAETQQAILTKKTTCEALVLAYLDRIKRFNFSVRAVPPINAFTELNRTVVDQARAQDHYFQTHQQLIGPLHCVPIVLKDNLDSYDMTNTSGSFALLGNQPIKDAFLVAKLRQAGAIFIGKGAMDEFAWGVSGISSRSGRVGNAYNTNENPGGSSAGSASAVSANFALVGIGTDNSASVRVPAVYNGLIGLRPSTGLISQQGIFPMGSLDGVAGPMARTVTDLAKVLDVIAVEDPNDPKTKNVPRAKSYTAFLNPNSFHGKRIGIIRRVDNIYPFAFMTPEATTIMQQTFKRLEQLGATIIDPIELPDFVNDRKNNEAGELDDVNAYLQSYPATRKNFQDICESDRTRTFGPINKCLARLKNMPKKDSALYQAVLHTFEKNRAYVERVMREHHLDALLMPISRKGSANYDPMSVITWRAPVASNAGLPAISFPVAYDRKHLPVGIELIGQSFSEGELIAFAYAFERQFAREQPQISEENAAIANLSIPELNNLISVLGKKTYDTILRNVADMMDRDEAVNPDVFRKLAAEVYGQRM